MGAKLGPTPKLYRGKRDCSRVSVWSHVAQVNTVAHTVPTEILLRQAKWLEVGNIANNRRRCKVA